MQADFHVGEWSVRPQLGEISSPMGTVSLKPRVMDLLVYLAEHPGEVLPKDHLLDTLWKDTFVTENTLMNAVSELRKALGDDTRDPSFITTHSKRGYRLIAPVQGTPQRPARPVTSSSRMRLAVLPFVSHRDTVGGPDVAETLTDLVITNLASSSQLYVVSRTSTTLWGREPTTLPELVRKLNVHRVLEGAVLNSQDFLRVAVRLYNEEDESLWGVVLEQPQSERELSLGLLARRIAQRIEAT